MTVRLENRKKIIANINCNPEDLIGIQDLSEKTGLQADTVRTALGQAGKHCFQPLKGLGFQRSLKDCAVEQGEPCLFTS